MATSFATIISYVRILIGDTDPSAYQYSDDILGSHLRLVLFELGSDESTIQEDPSTQNGISSLGIFTADLDSHTKARLIFRSVYSVVCGKDDHFSYQTPVMSVVRRGGTTNLIAYLQTKIDELEGGDFPISCDTELTAMVAGMTRYVNEFSNAFAISQQPSVSQLGIPKT